ncbi:hypothetical protein [Microbacterium sp. HJ5]
MTAEAVGGTLAFVIVLLPFAAAFVASLSGGGATQGVVRPSREHPREQWEQPSRDDRGSVSLSDQGFVGMFVIC